MIKFSKEKYKKNKNLRVFKRSSYSFFSLNLHFGGKTTIKKKYVFQSI